MAEAVQETKEPRSMNHIVEEIQSFLKQAEDNGFDDETIAATLEGMDYGIDEKLTAYRFVMDDLENKAKQAKASSDIYKEQAKPYADRSKTLDSERKRMTWPLLNLFKMLKIDKQKGSYGTFFIKKNPDKLHIEKDKVPNEFLVRNVSYSIDEAAIKEHLKTLPEGESLDFAWYIEGAEQVQLRK
ncbi:viral Gp157 protein [Vibrio crassostreae]|uniref:siphovirus Gp157 family protein n=1 Tax=Vibrio crassostreae TaxID=246167 RepID=UPI00104A04C6|nr:siphovirus Gp157 family protein [Vibrio crassostreae]TCN95758.1 viral Gp157 protein [Vibrio crassostreae]CAK2753421.1 Viral Gp157 protein [Vibrio crassostreae]CAK3364038.1 Viral Gp157 protein [Vibrio crassostreae]CAK3761877.1 Viral Gp157 protein [Vibrio crassostreae]